MRGKNVSLRPVRSSADRTQTAKHSTRPFQTLTTNSPTSAKKQRLKNFATLRHMFCHARMPNEFFGNWNIRKRARKTAKPEGFGFRADTPFITGACLLKILRTRFSNKSTRRRSNFRFGQTFGNHMRASTFQRRSAIFLKKSENSFFSLRNAPPKRRAIPIPFPTRLIFSIGTNIREARFDRAMGT